MYKISDYCITTRGYEIIDIKHRDFDTEFYLLDTHEKNELVAKAIEFCNGKSKSFNIWSDYDPEEASTRVYLSQNGFNLKIISTMENLIRAIYSSVNLYMVEVEDGLI